MTNQQAPEIYTLHTVPNKGERPWSGIYTVRADAEHDAKVMRDVTGRHWSVVRLIVADTNDKVPEAWTNLLAYVLQDELHNRPTPRVIDIAYTAFMQAKRPNDEDGGASDWFNDTRPMVRELIAKLRKDLIKELAGAPQPVPSATVALNDDLRDGLVAISKAIADQDDRAAQAMLREILRAPKPTPTSQAPFQQRVQPWLLECFGAEIAADRVERNHRFLEESLELVQALGCTASEAHQLVDYVFGRPVGDPPQEVGGVMVTLAALCLASGLDMHDAGEVELTRINAPELVAKIRAKQAAKPKHSPLPQSPTPPADSQPAHQRGTGYPPLPATYYLAGGVVRTWDEGQMRAYVDADRAARAQADSVTAPAGGVMGPSEPVFAFRRKGLNDFCTCTAERYAELSAKPNLFETRIFYTTPQTTQAQAGAVPLTDDELLAMWAGGDERFMRPVLGKNKVLAFGRAVEHRHGIKGGQHETE